MMVNFEDLPCVYEQLGNDVVPSTDECPSVPSSSFPTRPSSLCSLPSLLLFLPSFLFCKNNSGRTSLDFLGLGGIEPLLPIVMGGVLITKMTPLISFPLSLSYIPHPWMLLDDYSQINLLQTDPYLELALEKPHEKTGPSAISVWWL